MCDVRPCFAYVATHLPHDTDMVIAVEKVELLFPSSWPTAGPYRCFVGLECSIAEHHNESLGVLVTAVYRDVLFGDEPREVWWWEGLCSCNVRGHVR